MTERLHQGNLRRWTVLAVSLVLLNASLTFQNVWPTPAVRWQTALSIELVACVLAVAILGGFGWPLSRTALRWLGVFWVLLVVGRYADVTAPALYGRPINLYFDLRHVSAVAAMLARVASWWLILLVAGAAVAIPLLLYAIIRWLLGRVADAMVDSRARRTLGLLAGAGALLFAAQHLDARLPAVPKFSTPVTATYARQLRLLASELSGEGRRTLGPGPSMTADLTHVTGADVLLIFMESYGAVSYDRPVFAERLRASRAQFEADVRATGRDVVSAYVESPTFGGASWLAHISLLSGIEVRDEDTDALLLAQKRDTLVTTFARHGYRAVAIMPGLQQSWPEGVFYGFNEIYDGGRLDYHGPPFGWWSIPDQFALARLDALEVDRLSRAPLFAFFPTTATHTPFTPTPPYQLDWPRMLTGRPYEPADVNRAWLQEPDWLNLGPSYVRALSYAYTLFGGYLRLHARRDLVLILIGDHQPPAVVSGEGAPWDVPVHVIARGPQLLDALVAHGFRRGLAPQRPVLTRMHALTPVLLDAFSERE